MNTIMENGNHILAERRRELPNSPRPIGSINPLPAAPPSRTFEDGAVRRPLAERVTLATLDTSHPQVALAVKMAKAWAQRKRDGYQDASIILCGNNGVGKSHIARAIWWSMAARASRHVWNEEEQTFVEEAIPGTEQPSGLFKLSNDWIGLLGQSQDNETGIIFPARASVIVGRAPLVVIDDVGAEQTIPFIKADDVSQAVEREARLFKLIDHCYTAQVSVIITTNLQIGELATRLGRRSWDRLAQMAPRLPNGDSFIVDMFDVPSYRMKESGR